MHSPTTVDLPSPGVPRDRPQGRTRWTSNARTGWPWTATSPPLPGIGPAHPAGRGTGERRPRISIVTPSLNQGAFLEETIRSVLLQGYPDLEYVVVDGGSTDGSVEIIQQYAPWLSYWISEPDRGQAHAIDKGFAHCTGDVLGWLNSDDVLLPQALEHLAAAFERSPGAILAGDVVDLHQDSGHCQLLRQRQIAFESMVEPWRHNIRWHQPGIFFPRALYARVGSLDASLRYAFTRDWLCRALQVTSVHYLHVPVARFRYHAASKTVRDSASDWYREERAVTQRYWQQLPGFDLAVSEAALSVHRAARHLRLRSWDRGQGIACLIDAVRGDRRVLARTRVWLLALKAVMPLWLLRQLRALHLRFARRSLWVHY
jgi:glycosyltransferase involved in cell wall biosynthesis